MSPKISWHVPPLFFLLLAAGPLFGCAVANDSTPDATPTAAQATQALCDASASRSDRVGDGFWIDTNAQFDSVSGDVNVSSTVKTSRSVFGFTGGIIVALVDENKVAIAASDLQEIGVGACGFRCPRRRTVSWSFNVPEDARARVAGIAILHEHAATYRAFFKTVKYAQNAAQACATISPIIGKPELAVACKNAALGIAAVDPYLKYLLPTARERTVEDMMSLVEERAEMCL